MEYPIKLTLHMSEIKRVSRLLSELYDGSPWIDVNLVDSLSSITAKQAASHIRPGMNSIWEITNHLIKWRENVLERLNGKVIKSPAHNYFLPVKNQSDKAWTDTLRKLAASQEKWMLRMKTIKSSDFKTIYPVNRLTYYEHIQGIIQHDAYHLGQINLLKKFL